MMKEGVCYLKTTTFPLLKESTRMCKFKDFVWIIENLTDFRHIALPLEAAILSLCDGKTSIKTLVEIIHRITYKDSASSAKLLDTILDKFKVMLTEGNGVASNNKRYDWKEFLYSVEPLDEYPTRLDHPVEMLFTLTNNCNFRCIYCYNASGLAQEDELSTEDWLSIIEDADKLGVKKVALSGGEPFCHPGAIEIIKRLKEKDFLIEIATNGGVEYPNEVFDLLQGEKVQISLDTSDKFLFNELCSNDAFDKVIENIKHFVEANIYVNVKACITNLNYSNIDKLYDLLANIGVKNIGLAAYSNSFNGRGGEKLLLSEENIKSLNCDFEKVHQNGHTHMATSIPASYWSNKKDIICCGALFHTMIIQANGDVTGCENMAGIEEMQFGNIRNNAIMEIWHGDKANLFHYNKSHPSDEACATCDYYQDCQTGCFAEKHNRKIPLYGRDPRCRISNIM